MEKLHTCSFYLVGSRVFYDFFFSFFMVSTGIFLFNQVKAARRTFVIDNATGTQGTHSYVPARRHMCVNSTEYELTKNRMNEKANIKNWKKKKEGRKKIMMTTLKSAFQTRIKYSLNSV